ncbi:alpha/beta hydrolase [Bacillus sp. EAC]|uniref:alpha/beta hydrolase n=1 Tax=Bacillus sp. EAC TaxID=1978338 RepID=UPI000B43B4AC|nr:alpha/beta hydrolase [Bacillus sp. EAC]
MIFLLVVILLFLIYFVGIGFYFTKQVLFMKTNSLEYIYHRELVNSRFDEGWYRSVHKQSFSVQSRYDYELKGFLYEYYDTNKWVIITHGVTVNKNNSIKYVELFLKLGFNVLSYDHRRHGESGGHTTSYGFYEKYDLQTIIKFLKELKQNIVFGIHGESMGACTLLQYAGFVEDSADFYISDCAFATFEEQLAYRLKIEAHLPKWAILPVATCWLKLRDGFWINDINPLIATQLIKKPILFIHSKPDLYIPYSQTLELFEAKNQGMKELYIAENGAHAMSLNENKEEYYSNVSSFLSKIGIDHVKL